jgi:predicted transcriptional regulator of viral defense system
MRDEGQVEPLAKGLYRLADAPVPRNPDLLTVARKAPEAVVCLLSALAFHDLTTQVPHAVYVALPTGSRAPRLEHPPLEVFEFGGEAFSAGIQTHDLDGVPVRVYSPEKTLADCFKYRNRIGLEVAVEALRLYVERRAVRAEDIMRFARICRVARVMRPYLEATL